jgi:O-antigen/teichoic acid export membrane protein
MSTPKGVCATARQDCAVRPSHRQNGPTMWLKRETPGPASRIDALQQREDLVALARGGTLNVVGMVVNAVVAFALSVIVARALGASGAGSFFVALAFFTIIGVVAQFGADTGVVRSIARHQALGQPEWTHAVLKAGLWPATALGMGLGVALFVLAPEVARVIAEDRISETTTYLRIVAPCLPLATASGVVLAATRGFGAMLPFVAIERIGRSLLRLVLVVIVVAVGLGAAALMVVWVVPIAVGLVAAALWLWAIFEREAPAASLQDDRRPEARRVAREFWSFSSVRGLAATFRVGILWLDVVLVGALGSAHDAGIYATATRVVAAGSIVLQAVLLVIGPQISGLVARSEWGRAQSIYQVSTTWLTTLSFPLYLSVAAFAPLVLGIFGEEFTAGATALTILSLAMLIDMATGPVTTVLLMAGKSAWNLYNMATTLAVNIGLNVLLIPPFGLTGAAIAWAVALVVQNLVPLVQIWTGLGLHPFSGSLALAAAGSVLCFGGVGLLVASVLGTSAAAFAVFATLAGIGYVLFLARHRSTLLLDEFRDSLRRPSAAARPAS